MAKLCKYEKLVEYQDKYCTGVWTRTGLEQLGDLIEWQSADCGAVRQERWIPIYDLFFTDEDDCHYQIEKLEISNDGVLWYDGNSQRVVRTKPVYCGNKPEPIVLQYKWVLVEDEVLCEGYTSYQKKIRYVSYDNGITWNVLYPYEYEKGDKIEDNSTDCGYIYPKAIVTLTNGKTVEIISTGYGILYSNDISDEVDDPENTVAGVKIGEKITMIDENVFKGYKALTGITFNDRVSIIGTSFLEDAKINSIIFPKSLLSTGNDCLLNATITSVTLNDGLQTIGRKFLKGSSIKGEINIPATVNGINTGAFTDTQITSLIFNSEEPPSVTGTIGTENMTLKVPAQSLEKYKADVFSKHFAGGKDNIISK